MTAQKKDERPAVREDREPPAGSTIAADHAAEDNNTSSDLFNRPVYRVEFRPEPGIDAVLALRRLLKRALRDHGLRCLSVERVTP